MSDGEIYYQLTGYFIIVFGVLGVILNSHLFVFFLKYKPAEALEAYPTLKKIFLNLSFIDLLFSISACCVRGPGYIWPTEVYDVSGPNDTSTRCEALSLGAIWFLSNQNLYGILPFSIIAGFMIHIRLIYIILVMCWLMPITEIIFIVIGIQEGHLTLSYDNEYRRCALAGDWTSAVDITNLVLFGAIPLLIHCVSIGRVLWTSRCRCECNARLLTSCLVVVPFVITWLPYLIVYQISDVVDGESSSPGGSKSLIYIFFYFSIVYNPLVYGYYKYKCMVFTGGCYECLKSVPPEDPSSSPPVLHRPASSNMRNVSAGDMTSNVTSCITSGSDHGRNIEAVDVVEGLSSI